MYTWRLSSSGVVKKKSIDLKCSIFHELFGFLLNLSIQNYMKAEPVGCKDIGCNETGFKNEVDEPNKLNKILCTKKVLFWEYNGVLSVVNVLPAI